MIVRALVDDIGVEIPDDVAAILALMGYVLHATYPAEHGGAHYCDVWKEGTRLGARNAGTDRVFCGAYHVTYKEAIDAMCEWVRAGCPNGYGEALR